MKIHTIKEGESMYDVAGEYGISPLKLADINGIDRPIRLPVGRELLVNLPTRTYNVRRGDRLSGIAARFKTDVQSLFRLNPELRGRERLYDGQLLVIKYGTPTYGNASVNGYCYYGVQKDRLTKYLPYLNYLTVCSAKSEGSGIIKLFDDRALIEAAKRHKKCPILRIYVSRAPRENEELDFVTSVKILCNSQGYRGVTLANLTDTEESQAHRMLEMLRKELYRDGLMLGIECAASEERGYLDLADFTVLYNDRIHLSPIPSFDDGERAVFEEYALRHNSSTAQIELSGFALLGEKYIDKELGIEIADRRCDRLQRDQYTLVTGCEYKGKPLLFESLTNTKAKLEAVSELGFMGISFDIMRLPIAEIMMFSSMFAPITASGCGDDGGYCRGAM